MLKGAGLPLSGRAHVLQIEGLGFSPWHLQRKVFSRAAGENTWLLRPWRAIGLDHIRLGGLVVTLNSRLTCSRHRK